MKTIIKFKVQFIDIFSPLFSMVISVLTFLEIIYINISNKILFVILSIVLALNAIIFIIRYISIKVNPYIVLSDKDILVRNNYFKKAVCCNLDNVKKITVKTGEYIIELITNKNVKILKNQLSNQEKIILEKLFEEINDNMIL